MKSTSLDIQQSVSIDSELEERLKNCPYKEGRARYLVTKSDVQIGILLFDLYYEDAAVLYEIFIRSPLRRKGLGTRVLKYAEAIAQEKGFRILQLLPRSLDKDLSDENLREWYSRQGYRPSKLQEDLLEKEIE